MRLNRSLPPSLPPSLPSFPRRQIEYRAIHPLPPAILRSYSMLQSMSFQGIFPEIHRAWVTVDNILYIWDYHTEGEGEGGKEGGGAGKK